MELINLIDLSLKVLALRTEKHVCKSSILSLSPPVGLFFICTHVLLGAH